MRKTKSRERIRILSLVVVLLLLPTMMFAIPESGKKVTLNLESTLEFTGQTAALVNTDTIEIVRQNLGFDLENGVTQVSLDLAEPHYYLEIRPLEG